MSLSSQLGLNDMEALLWGPPYLTADHLGSVLDEDGDEVLPEGAPSPFSSSYYADTPPSPIPAVLSPPSPSITGCKMGTELPPLPWLSADELLASTMCADGGKEDAFTGMEWMTEKIDLSEFDLDSLMGSCDSDEPRSPPDDLITSLECHMDLDLTAHSSFMTTSASHKEEINVSFSEVSQVPLEQPQKVEVKSEPLSPVLLPPPSPSFTLELGSEVDVSESEKVALTDKVQAPKIILSLPPSLVVVLAPAPKELATVSTTIASGSDDQSDSDSGFGSDSGLSQNHSCSTPPPGSAGTSRTKPYSAPSKSKPALEPVTLTGKVKSASGAPRVVEKKLKKMEQNKTAATRYRQKKRAEQEALSSECSELEQKNRELEEKADSISKEIQYLKDLIEEVRKAKSKKNEGGGK